MINSNNKLKNLDFFDRLMLLPFLRIFNPFYTRNKEVLLYLFFGGLSFFLNFALFIGINHFLQINELINNILCWIICVLFQFFTNRTWVFKSHVTGISACTKQFLDFTSARIITLVLEEIILMICITWLGWNTIAIKLVAQTVVIILNYAFSKIWIFKKK